MDNQVHNQIVSFIWGIADDCLRDIYVRGKYRDVILPMTVIRRLDAMLEDTKPKVLGMKEKLDKAGIDNQWPALCNAAGQAFCNASPFLLKDLTSRAKKQTLKTDFELYLDGFSPNVQEILEKFKFRNQIQTMIDADILGSVIEKFTSPDINLSPIPVYKDDAKTILKHPGLDNHGMGTIFEELIRKFNEENNEEAGEHWTPRDVVELMADLVFMPIADQIKDATYSCYDGCCGTGGMLTVAQERLTTLAAQRGKNVSIHMFGQEIQPETYAICKADMLLKGEGEQADHISYGSTLSYDGNASRQFDFMLSNPPYGKSWKTDAEKMGGKKDILDSRFNAYMEDGEQLAMIPRTSDGQLLFLLNNVAKMKKDTPLGSRIAEVHNGSSIFTGDAGSGESNARRYMIENDLVEAIIAVPENMFYNTGIGTFIWILSNKKEERRKGKVQLIDATAMKSPLRKNMGKKNCEFTPEIRKEIVRIFLEMEESDVSMIFDNKEFGYWSVTVDRPLRQKVTVNADTVKETLAMFKHLYNIDLKSQADDIPEVSPADVLDFSAKNPNVREIKLPKSFGVIHMERVVRAYMDFLCDIIRLDPYMDYNKFVKDMYKNPHIKNCEVNFKKFEDFMYPLIEKDPNAEIVRDNKGNAVVDTDLRDTENIPFTYEGGIDAFMQNEVLTYAPDAWADDTKTQIGYEISFTKYFYKPVEMREMSDMEKCNLGSGSFGKTVLLKDPYIDELFVAKKYEPEFKSDKEPFFQNFLDEIKILYKLNHRNIVRIYNYYAYEEAFTGYILMEYIDGKNIADFIENAVFEDITLDNVFLQLIDAFCYIEGHNIIHRDIREGNILIDKTGTVKVIDFGIGKIFKSPDANMDSLVHDINRAASDTLPAEYHQGIYTSLTDMFYLAEMLHRLIAKNKMLDESDFSYHEILNKMMEKNPEDRYENFASIREAAGKHDFINIDISDEDKSIYQNFTNTTLNAIVAYLEEPIFNSDITIFVERLEKALRKNVFEDTIQNNADIINSLVNCGFRYNPSVAFSTYITRKFLDWFRSSTVQSQELILNNFIAKISNVRVDKPDEYPF